MDMGWLKNSKKGKFACLAGVSILIYSILVFIIFGFSNGSSFWISYVFAKISFLLSYMVAYFSVNSAKRLTDWIFSLPVMRWCVIYVAVELIIATVFMIINTSWKIAFIPQFLIPIFFLVLVVPCFAQKSHAKSLSQETVVKVSVIRQMNAKLIALIPRIEDTSLKREVEKAAEMLRHSDPMSADCLLELEQKLSDVIDQTDKYVRENNYEKAAPLAREICLLIEERNQLVIASKLIQY